MTGSPRVSVVVIVRDGERFLAEALESVRAQSFDDWEVLVVDDGSRDGSREVVARFVEREPGRFRLLRHEGGENRGMSASRNLGIAHARGEFVTFLDHDDCMLPAKLASQASLLDRYPEANAVIGPNLRWHAWSGSRPDTVQDLGIELDRLHPPPGLLPVYLARTSATPQSPLVRRAALDAIGGFEDEFRDMYEDQVFFAKLFLEGPVYISGEVQHRYRQHDESCVHQAHRSGRHLAARRRYLDWLSRRIERVPAHRAALASAIRRERLRLWWAGIRLRLRLRK